MNDKSEYKPNADEIWPPPPMLPLPAKPRELPFLVRLPLWGIVLVDAGIGLIAAALSCLKRWFMHHTLHWVDPAIEGVVIFLVYLALHLWVRSVFLKRDLEERNAREVAEQGSPTQDATE